MANSRKKVPISAHLIDDYTQTYDDSPQPTPAMNNVSRDSLYDWYWKMPEVRAIVSTIVSDIFSEGYSLDGTKARVEKTKRFLQQNRFNQNMKSVVRDMIISGDGYLGKASLTESQILIAMDCIYQDVFQKSASPESQSNVLSKVLSAKPDIYSPKVLFPLMSRSIKIRYDQHGTITGYTQSVKNAGTAFATGSNPSDDVPGSYTYGTMSTTENIEFLPEEVIHFPYEPVGDMVYGTSPLQTALYDVISLWYAKTYGGLFFQNDATPSFIFNLPDDAPDSPNFLKFKEAIKQHRSNPHRTMVITGNVGINRVASLSKDLEFSNFIDKFTQRIMLAFGASARFGHLFGKQSESPATLEMYYKTINSIQTDIEDILNAELFSLFDIEFTFNRVYKRDETREADIAVKLTNLVLSVNESREFLGYKPLDNPDFDELIPVQKERAFMEEVSSADARTEQNAVATTSRGNMKGDKPVNGDSNE